MARKILSSETINQMQYEAYKEESMKNKKKGSPVDHMLDINDSSSILSSYVKRKTEEYNLAMENFEEDFEEKKKKYQKKLKSNDEDDEDGEEEVVIGGTGSYKTDNEEEYESESDKVIQLETKEENINPNNIIDDLL